MGIVKPILSEISPAGESFAVPKTMKDNVFSYRNSIPSDIVNKLPIEFHSETFLLTTNETCTLRIRI
ncbi:MAG: hypothetical protein QW607_10270 [Desulfurococcaceae archaeon]